MNTTRKPFAFDETSRAEISKRLADRGYVSRWENDGRKIHVDCKCGSDFADTPHVLWATGCIHKTQPTDPRRVAMEIDHVMWTVDFMMWRHIAELYPNGHLTPS